MVSPQSLRIGSNIEDDKDDTTPYKKRLLNWIIFFRCFVVAFREFRTIRTIRACFLKLSYHVKKFCFLAVYRPYRPKSVLPPYLFFFELKKRKKGKYKVNKS